MIALATLSAPSVALTVVGSLLVLAGCVTALFSVYLLLLSISALFYSSGEPDAQPQARLLVLVPAHNESQLIAHCLRSLLDQTYPRDQYSVVVIADNCTDDTATIAADAGADIVLTRVEPRARGKGQALRWAIDRLLPAHPDADAVVVIDADSIADPSFLVKLVLPFDAGALAVQGESLLHADDSQGSALRATAFLLINRVRPAGRAVLRLGGTHLAGNGMLLARSLLTAKPWGAFTSAEDLEYSLDLQADGISAAFAGGAVLMSPTAPNPSAAAQQQLRWEGGRLYLVRTRLPGLLARAVRERKLTLLGVAFDLAVPPLGALAAICLTGCLIGAGLAALGLLPLWTLGPWVIGTVAIPLFVIIGLIAGDAPKAGYRALIGAPLLILAKPLKAYQALSFRGDTWVRTERAGEHEARSEV
jgi:1,2-diacylglycerol 3-beta-glucosyltransferase